MLDFSAMDAIPRGKGYKIPERKEFDCKYKSRKFYCLQNELEQEFPCEECAYFRNEKDKPYWLVEKEINKDEN